MILNGLLFATRSSRKGGNPFGKKADVEVSQTYTWIQSHLEEDSSVSLPKHEVYEEYKAFCEANKFEPLCVADFGKAMKHVFPKVKPRRLGQRGNSKYCYSGLRKKLKLECPELPDLDCTLPISTTSVSDLKKIKEENESSTSLGEETVKSGRKSGAMRKEKKGALKNEERKHNSKKTASKKILPATTSAPFALISMENNIAQNLSSTASLPNSEDLKDWQPTRLKLLPSASSSRHRHASSPYSINSINSVNSLNSGSLMSRSTPVTPSPASAPLSPMVMPSMDAATNGQEIANLSNALSNATNNDDFFNKDWQSSRLKLLPSVSTSRYRHASSPYSINSINSYNSLGSLAMSSSTPVTPSPASAPLSPALVPLMDGNNAQDNVTNENDLYTKEWQSKMKMLPSIASTTRHRHASSPYSINSMNSYNSLNSSISRSTPVTPNGSIDSFSQEIQSILDAKNGNSTLLAALLTNKTRQTAMLNRCQSVPINQMSQTGFYQDTSTNCPSVEVSPTDSPNCLNGNYSEGLAIHSHPATPTGVNGFTFPLSPPPSNSIINDDLSGTFSVEKGSVLQSGQDVMVSGVQMHNVWSCTNGGDELIPGTANGNANGIAVNALDEPADDLQTTLDDLRDCDNDFSKFEQLGIEQLEWIDERPIDEV